MKLPNYIMSARHIMPNVRTDEDYRARQAANLVARRQKFPNLELPVAPWNCDLPVPVFVANGTWLIECPCKNCPAVEPAWATIARCYECGAVFTHLTMPADYLEIERLLLERGQIAQRYWNPTMSLEALRAITAKLREREVA